MDSGIYLYAIGRSDARASPEVQETLRRLSGLDPSHALEQVSVNGLNAFFSRVSLNQFGRDSLKRNLQDMPWLEKNARAHDAIVKQILESGTIVPVRFGTVFLSLDGLKSALETNRQELQELLCKLDGLDEMGVTLNFNKREVTKYLERTDHSLEQLTQKMNHAGSGAAYLLQKKLDVTRQQILGAFINDCVSAASANLERKSRAVKQSGLLTRPDDRSQVYVSLACLVPANEEETFVREAKSVSGIPPDAGISVRVTGPWPPYSFSAFHADNTAAQDGSHVR